VTSVASGTLDRLRGADFLDIAQLDTEQLRAILDLARDIKAGRWNSTPLAGRSLALIAAPPTATGSGCTARRRRIHPSMAAN